MRPRIFILDDDPVFGKLLAANLGRAGEFKIEKFTDPRACLEATAVDLPDAVFTDAVSVVSVDSLATELEFKVGSLSNTLPAGVTVVVEYSDDGGSTWTYTPLSGACGASVGYDLCVERIRWRFQNPLPSTGPDNIAEFEYVARIR